MDYNKYQLNYNPNKESIILLKNNDLHDAGVEFRSLNYEVLLLKL